MVPDWSSLPYEILVTIFRYASEPLRDDSLLRPKPTTNWLLGSARICKAFSEPALTALYESPPLVDLAGPHGLLSLLKQSYHASGLTYSSKIKRIELDANYTLAYTLTGWGKIDLAELLCSLPQLSDVRIIEESDNPPYRPSSVRQRWTYPQEMFSTMSDKGVRLRSWHWNAQMIKRAKLDEPMFLPEFSTFVLPAHESKALQSVRELSISHLALYQRKVRNDCREEEVRQELTGDHLRRVLAPLKNLKHLSLISCSAFDTFERDVHSIMQALPRNLESLSIKNTHCIYSEPLIAFLIDHGRNLRELVLDHNQALDLSFLTILKASCPRLRRLHMDLTFYHAIGSYKEKDPLFDTLLPTNDIPTWPATLQSLELYNLRPWASDAAETFFSSLIAAASELPALRFLAIKAILSMSWRDRADFRETWISRLHHVFLRRSKPPDRRLASKRAFREEWTGSHRSISPLHSPNQHRNRLAGLEKVDESEAGPTPTRARRSQRIKDSEAEKEARRQDEESQETDASIASLQRSEWKSLANVQVQGMCEVVDIGIDNFRPAEVHFDEADFIDSEPEDEEWRGDGLSSSPRYAW